MCEFQHVFRLLSLMLLTGISCRAAVVTDTLFSAHNDRVIVTYDITYNDNKTSIRFLDANKKLGGINKGRYSKLSEVKVMFFDRVGNYGDNTKFTGRSVKAFSVPAYARYHRSDDGYFLINEEPAITFDIDNGQKPTLSIPIYLAHYEKKKNYLIFAECAPLKIDLAKKKTASSNKSHGQTASNYEKRTITETVTEEVEAPEEGISKNSDALMTINQVQKLLMESGDEISPMVENRISHLMDIQSEVSPEISSKIDDVLGLYNQRKAEIKDNAASAQAAAEKKAQDAVKEAEARQDSINAATEAKQQQENEKNKKRNMWMVIGAVILGVLGFGGNQLAQNMRNAKNQKSMMDMQQSMVRRAENEARRRAQSYARNKAHQAVNQVKSKSRQAVQSNVNKLGNAVKGKKKDNGGVSI